jgi:hypothetical protein
MTLRSRCPRTCAVVVLTAALTAPQSGATAGAPAGSGPAAQAPSLTLTLGAAVRRLDVGREVRSGYDRDEFGDWIDADGDCRDTRDEVLAEESRDSVGDACDVSDGLWYSYYDGVFWTDSGDVDIDHMVPMAEAWDSGARGWAAGTRRRFANDLGDPRSLVAVTDNVNSSKGDSDPAEWLPEQRICRYVVEYVAVKVRWSLRIDLVERRALRALVEQCPGRTITVTRART